MATRNLYRPSSTGPTTGREVIYAGWLKKVRWQWRRARRWGDDSARRGAGPAADGPRRRLQLKHKPPLVGSSWTQRWWTIEQDLHGDMRYLCYYQKPGRGKAKAEIPFDEIERVRKIVVRCIATRRLRRHGPRCRAHISGPCAEYGPF